MSLPFSCHNAIDRLAHTIGQRLAVVLNDVVISVDRTVRPFWRDAFTFRVSVTVDLYENV